MQTCAACSHLCRVDKDRELLRYRIGSAIATPVAASDPLLTMIFVEVLFPSPSFCEKSAPAFVTARSMSDAIASCSSAHTLFATLLFASPEYSAC